MKVGDVYRLTESARTELGPDRDKRYDVVRVCAEVFMGETADPDWCVVPADGEFAPVIQSSEQAILDNCELVSAGSPPRVSPFGFELP